jgi:hypothetical protein
VNIGLGSKIKMLVGTGLLSLSVVLISSPFVPPATIEAQHREKSRPSRASVAGFDKGDLVERAINVVCEARRQDAQGTVPIDEMAFAPPLSLTDSRVSSGRARAMALLPVAKRLVPFAVRRVAIANGVEPRNLKWIITRVQAVKTIRPEVGLHDNASWLPSEPDTILFGTVFLAGLRSDEAMLSVLAHELTHAINGDDGGLEPIFTRLRARAQRGEPISENAAVELACEMVGLETLRDHITQTKGQGVGSGQRLGRGLQKDCVRTDLSDEDHLSPRGTMRALLQLDPALLSAITRGPAPTKKITSPRKSGKKIRKK